MCEHLVALESEMRSGAGLRDLLGHVTVFGRFRVGGYDGGGGHLAGNVGKVQPETTRNLGIAWYNGMASESSDL